MPLKRSTRNSNNTSINVNNVSSSTSNNVSNIETGKEDSDKKHKNKPYYSWW